MGLPPGAIRSIGEEDISSPFFITTHALPLTFLVQALRETSEQVELVGIQPGLVAFGCPVSPEVQQAVEQVYAGLERGVWAWETWEAPIFQERE